VISANEIGWRIGGATILDDISVAVGAGELLGIIGPNGAGKSSLVNILSGTVRPTTGSIELAGQDVTRLSATARSAKGLARSFQTSALFDGLTAAENVRLAIQGSRPGRLSLVRTASSTAPVGQVSSLLDRVRMPGRAQVLAGALSHGDRRKLELAMAMAADPRVLLLDEPMAGVSAEDVDGLTAIIAEVRDSGVAVLMVEHHMHVVLGLADRVAVIHHGRLLALGSADEVTADPEVQQAYLGEAL
jgi:branched-chain amino acid transport system ATP-binding protein